MRKLVAVASLMIVAGMLVACQTGIPEEALQLSPQSLEFRQLQTRVFETRDETFLLAASAGLLQDLGFNLDESETDLGVIVASKNRDATEAAQVVGAVLLALLGAPVAIDDVQKIRASIVTRPHGDPATRTSVRVTFQRIIWKTDGKIGTVEKLEEPEMYQVFFEKLSKAVFLEAEKI